MNKTKKLTQGAMMLAILGALIIIDRVTAFLFTELVVLIAPIIIILYSAMQSFKDGLLLSIGVLIISFILGNFQMTYLIYIPVGIVTALVYSYGVLRSYNKSTLVFISCATYIVGELIASYVVYPLFGFPISQMITEFKVAMNEVEGITGVNYASTFNSMGLDFDNIIIILYFIAIIFTGAMEGFLIHILVIFLLKRFKIKDLGRFNIWDIKPSKALSYISFLSMFYILFRDRITNQTLTYVLFTMAIIGFMILIYYGYLFVTLYGVIVLKKNIGGLFIIASFFIPFLLFALMIMGFLYGSGPLRVYLENKMNSI